MNQNFQKLDYDLYVAFTNFKNKFIDLLIYIYNSFIDKLYIKPEVKNKLPKSKKILLERINERIQHDDSIIEYKQNNNNDYFINNIKRKTSELFKFLLFESLILLIISFMVYKMVSYNQYEIIDKFLLASFPKQISCFIFCSIFSYPPIRCIYEIYYVYDKNRTSDKHIRYELGTYNTMLMILFCIIVPVFTMYLGTTDILDVTNFIK